MFDEKIYNPDVITEARRRMRNGEFKRQVIARTPRDIHTDDLMLECGHASLGMLGFIATSETCSDCIRAWMRDETEKRKV